MELKDLSSKMARFVQAMGWNEGDSPKPQTGRNLAISLSLEAAEVLELFQWTDDLPDQRLLATDLADVCLYLLKLDPEAANIHLTISPTCELNTAI